MAKKSNRIVNYFKEVKSELKKVVWPSFKQVKNNTLIVIACVLIIGAFIWVWDAVLGISLGNVIDRLQGEDAVVEDTVDNAETTNVSDEETQAILAQMGIKYDAATGKYTDAETGAELTEEDVNSRISALSAESETTTEENTDAE